MTTSGSIGFYFPGNGALKGTNYVALNFIGGEIIMTKAAVTKGAVDESGVKAYVEEEQRGVNLIEFWKWAVYAYINVTGGTFTYAPVGAVGEGKVAPESHFLCAGNGSTNLTMTGGTIQGFDMAFWGSYNATCNVTLGAQGATTYPTVNVNKAIFYSPPQTVALMLPALGS